MSGSTSASSRICAPSSGDGLRELADGGPQVALAFDGAEDLLQAWASGLTPDPDLTVSAWADRHRILSPRGANEAGPWRTSRTPYLQELMDALSPRHPAQRVVFMKGSQVGATEAAANWIGYVIHHAPGPMLAVQPSVELAKRFSQQRIDPLIEESPSLREKVAPARSRDSGNTVLSKEFPGGILVLTGANSAVGLRSMPVRYLFLDEVDAYPPSADDEGDPVALAEARTRTFSWRRKVFLASTPTIKGLSRIEREYEASDQRRFFVPCPHCGHPQHLIFERLRWQKGAPETAAYVCEGCERPIAEHHKTRMLAEGEWRPTATPTLLDRRYSLASNHHAKMETPLTDPVEYQLKQEIDGTISRLAATRFKEDPIVPARFSKIASIVSSSFKRHGPILERALAKALEQSGRFDVWNEPRFAVSDAADRLADTDSTSADADLPYLPDRVARILQVDLMIYDRDSKRLVALEVKRGFGYHDSGKKRSMLRDLRCQSMLMRSYGKYRGLDIRDALARIVFYYGERSVPPPWSLTRDDLDAFFEVPIVDSVEKVNTYFKERLYALLAKA